MVDRPGEKTEPEGRERKGGTEKRLVGVVICCVGDGCVCLRSAFLKEAGETTRGCLHVESAIGFHEKVLDTFVDPPADPPARAQHLDLALSGEQARPGLVCWTL